MIYTFIHLLEREIAKYEDMDLNHIETKVDHTRKGQKCQPKNRNNPEVTDYEDVTNKGLISYIFL